MVEKSATLDLGLVGIAMNFETFSFLVSLTSFLELIKSIYHHEERERVGHFITQCLGPILFTFIVTTNFRKLIPNQSVKQSLVDYKLD